jgi:hypothetical protein
MWGTMMRCRLLTPLAAVCALALGPGVRPAPAAEDSAALEFFEKKIRPVLIEHCYACHSARAKKIKGGLRLDSRSGLLRGGDTGPALVPGRPEQSRLIQAVRYLDVDLRMPPKGKLPAAAVADLTAWIEMGAPWAMEEGGRIRKEEGGRRKEEKKTASIHPSEKHWAWQPVRPSAPPVVKDTGWVTSPVDAFILARLEEKRLRPNAPSAKRELVRRVSFDLIGLPPAPAEVEAFVRDPAPDAFAQVVDRLLASPHFGERWGRHWLDLVRYAESHGHEFDYVIPNAHHYRDYVIRALNADVPYDQFITEHLAGDLLDRPRRHPTEGFNESILGTGFWFLGEELHSPVDVRQDQADRFDNRIDVTTKAFLGLTVACARCHDHKFDTISSRDYYALYGILASSGYRLARFDTMEAERQIAAELWKFRERGRPVLLEALAKGLRPGVDRTADYLLAAREVLAQADPEEVAQTRKLDGKRLNRWVAALRQAAKDEHDPLYAWAMVAESAKPQVAAGPIIKRWRRRDAEAAAALKEVEIIVDYGQPRPGDWLPDGVAFGPGPMRPGEVRIGTDPAHPVAKIYDRAAAEKDPTWDGLRPAAGAQNDAGALDGLMRAGRTLRTPTFTLTGGKLYYLVKGSGQAYAAVCDHALIAGPLHAQLVQPLRSDGRFQWVAHDLSPYQGQRTHIEFTPRGYADFAVALVVQSATPPRSLDRPNAELLRLLSGRDAASAEALAAGYQRLFGDVLERLAGDRLVGDADRAGLADWLLRHEDLFSGGRRRSAEVRSLLADQDRLLAHIRPESRLAPAMWDGSGVDERVFIRGSPKALGVAVPRRFLAALAGPGRLLVARGSGRLELARLMTDPARNPFLARVLVNRVWHHLFGRGIVASVDNFGVLGDRPTHPELLDYLADRFVRQGWSVKRLIRELVLSSTYRMSSRPDPKADQADPQNLLLHRTRLRRLEGEAIRDALLAVSGRLDRRLYGPPVAVHLTAFQDGRGKPETGPLDGAGRRSVYLAARRNFLSSFLLAFDTPAPASTVGRRTVSNVPAQALILMNDPFVHQQAEVWANRVHAQGGTMEEKIIGMYQSAFARPPDAAELQACVDFLNPLSGGRQPPERSNLAAWTDLAHVLFNAKEFIFVN